VVESMGHAFRRVLDVLGVDASESAMSEAAFVATAPEAEIVSGLDRVATSKPAHDGHRIAA
jgi:hypothetical protein